MPALAPALPAGGTRRPYDEAKHHRGQPGNRGQFGPGGGGTSPAPLAKRVASTGSGQRRVAVAPRKAGEDDASYRDRIRAKAIANKASPEQADRVADLMTKHSRGATSEEPKKPAPAKPTREQAKATLDKAKAAYEEASLADFTDPFDDAPQAPEAKAAVDKAKAGLDKAKAGYSAAIGVRHARGTSDVFHSAGFDAVERTNGLGFHEVGIVGHDAVSVRSVTPDEAARIAKDNPDALFHGSPVAGLRSLGTGGGNLGDAVYFTPDAKTAAVYAGKGGAVYVYDGRPLNKRLDLDKPVPPKDAKAVGKAFADHGYGHVDAGGTGHEALVRLLSAIHEDGPRPNGKTP